MSGSNPGTSLPCVCGGAAVACISGDNVSATSRQCTLRRHITCTPTHTYLDHPSKVHHQQPPWYIRQTGSIPASGVLQATPGGRPYPPPARRCPPPRIVSIEGSGAQGRARRQQRAVLARLCRQITRGVRQGKANTHRAPTRRT
jgi:hypothetical protein